MKVIRGFYKNTILYVPPNTRVPSMRVKKSLFDILKEKIEESYVLDLFSGSGSLGIEALSLGAKKVTFVDIRKHAIDVIVRNLSTVKSLGKSELVFKDAFKAIKDFSYQSTTFDIILADPPYHKGLGQKTLQTLDRYDILAPYGIIAILSYYKDEISSGGKNLVLMREEFYGDTFLRIYGKKEESNLSRDV